MPQKLIHTIFFGRKEILLLFVKIVARISKFKSLLGRCKQKKNTKTTKIVFFFFYSHFLFGTVGHEIPNTKNLLGGIVEAFFEIFCCFLLCCVCVCSIFKKTYLFVTPVLFPISIMIHFVIPIQWKLTVFFFLSLLCMKLRDLKVFGVLYHVSCILYFWRKIYFNFVCVIIKFYFLFLSVDFRECHFYAFYNHCLMQWRWRYWRYCGILPQLYLI